MIWFYIYLGIVFACLVSYLLNRQAFPSYFKNFSYLFVAIIIFELAGLLLPEKHNNLLDHIYQPIEITLLSIIYWHIIESKEMKKVVLYSTTIYWLFCAFSSLLLEGIYSQNTLSFISGSVIIAFYSLCYVYQLYSQPPKAESLLVNTFFWINTAHLFFYYGTFFQMGLDAYIKDRDAALARKLEVINFALNYTLYILYLIGFLCKKIFK